MIYDHFCINCNKKFEINSDLIPEKGRLLNVVAVIMNGFTKKKNELVLDKQS